LFHVNCLRRYLLCVIRLWANKFLPAATIASRHYYCHLVQLVKPKVGQVTGWLQKNEKLQIGLTCSFS
jgi:hypothetical protein